LTKVEKLGIIRGSDFYTVLGRAFCLSHRVWRGLRFAGLREISGGATMTTPHSGEHGRVSATPSRARRTGFSFIGSGHLAGASSPRLGLWPLYCSWPRFCKHLPWRVEGVFSETAGGFLVPFILSG
jgi:hypothetical protein